MEQQKWTIKQVLFEKEIKCSAEPLYFNGFEMPKDKDVLIKTLDEILENYSTKVEQKFPKELVDKHIKLSQLSKFYVSIILSQNEILVTSIDEYSYPKQKYLLFLHGGHKTYLERGGRYRNCFIHRGLHIHKDCLEIGETNETTEMYCQTSSI